MSFSQGRRALFSPCRPSPLFVVRSLGCASALVGGQWRRGRGRGCELPCLSTKREVDPFTPMLNAPQQAERAPGVKEQNTHQGLGQRGVSWVSPHQMAQWHCLQPSLPSLPSRSLCAFFRSAWESPMRLPGIKLFGSREAASHTAARNINTSVPMAPGREPWPFPGT